MFWANEKIILLSDEVATGEWKTVSGGGYLLTLEASAWSTAEAQLEIGGPKDGTTAIPLQGFTYNANAAAPIALPPGARVRMKITGGPPTAVYATLRSAAFV